MRYGKIISIKVFGVLSDQETELWRHLTTFRKIDHKCSTLIPLDEILEKLDLRVDICWISIDKIYINGYSSLYGLPRVPL